MKTKLDNIKADVIISLLIWKLSSKSRSVPVSHSEVLAYLDAQFGKGTGQGYLDRLVKDDWVRCNIYGSYELTKEGIALRKELDEPYLPITPETKDEPKDVNPWGDFRKLVNYYIDCVHQQERKQEYLSSKYLGKTFCVPILEHGWLKYLGEKPAEISVPINDGNFVPIQMLRAKSDFEEDIYIGYPMEAFNKQGKIFYTPLALIPADIIQQGSNRHELRLKIRHDEAALNRTWLEYRFHPNELKHFEKALDLLHAKDEFSGLTDVKMALPFLAEYGRQEGAKPNFNSDMLDGVLPANLKTGEHCLCNCPTLFVGKSLQYSRTLKRELEYIASQEDKVLDQTALAYVFRKPCLKDADEKSMIGYSFIASNDNQHLAVDRALNSLAGKITGPPGTGKSQVAVNIISNLILHGKSVLFTSRNHKAVHAIWERSRQVLPNLTTPLIHFCTSPKSEVEAEAWNKLDVNVFAEQVSQEYTPDSKYVLANLLDGEEECLSILKPLESYPGLEYQLSIAVHSLERIEGEIIRLSKDEHFCDNPIAAQELKNIYDGLRNPPKGRGVYGLIDKILWILFKRKKHHQAWQELEAKCPSLAKSMWDLGLVKDRLMRLAVLLSQREERQKKLYSICGECEQLPNREERMEPLQELMAPPEDKLKKALSAALLGPAAHSDQTERTRFRALMNEYPNSNSLFLMKGLNTERVVEDSTVFKKFLRIAPAWAVTLLSLTKASPCFPAVFDRVVIDEASQCDVPPIIPALYRAKGAVIIGDPNQFPPVFTLKTGRNDYLKNRHRIEDDLAAFDYLKQTAYSVMESLPVLLTDHYRCHSDIADYFNEEYYGGKLNALTNEGAFAQMVNDGLKLGVEWIDIKDSISDEIDMVVQKVDELAKAKIKGSVGVITPSKKLATELETRLNKYRNSFSEELLVNTVNAFQGGEKDVIIFMLGYTSDQTKGQIWYLEAGSNRYLYNVAVSRARACLILVGDKERCASSTATPLKKLSRLPRSKPPVPGSIFDSVWEERLYYALDAEGIKVEPQYRLVGRRLDLAVVTDNVKLDIEVDGVRWHTDDDGMRKPDDIWRDIQVQSVGWKVIRFWVYELQRDMPACVRKIKAALREVEAE